MPAVQFTHPWSLVLLGLLLPAGWLARHSLAGLSGRRARWAFALRATVLVSLVLALAGLQLVRRSGAMGIVYAIDRSESIPDAARRRALEFIAAARDGMRPDDTAAAVAFGKVALVEQTSQPRLELTRLESEPDPSFTDLSAAIRLAVATADPGRRRRVVLFSDGNENLGDGLTEARLARALGVGVDVVPLPRQPQGEVVAERLLIPGELRRGDTLEARAVVSSDTTTSARLRLLRDNAVESEVTAALTPGKNVIGFPPLTLQADGFHGFSLEVEPATDSDQRNNRALGFTFVTGRQKVLYVEGDAGQDRYLANALARTGLMVNAVSPGNLPTSLPALAAYDCLILSNVSALDLSEAQMVMIRSAVRDLGIGLVMIGGDESFGVGGYYRTPVEEALPVDMDIRKMRHLPNVGVAIVIDQSGSMSMMEAGHQKIQLANEAAIALVSVLGPQDRVAVIATDSQAKPVTGPALQPVASKQALIDEISRIRAGGGGIYCYTGLKRAADMVRAANTKLKHIILFADAADSEEQEGCRELIAELAREKVTTTVVALGRESDPDVEFLKDVARLGKGRYYITHQATTLPRIFTREAILASRSQVVEKTFTPQLSTSIEALRGIHALPPLQGYVATTAKPSAEVALIAEPKYKDPVLATWQFGLGRAVAFTSDCKAHWAVDWVGWSGYDKFWSQVVRWSLRQVRRGEFETRVASRLNAAAGEAGLRLGEARVTVDAVDESGQFINRLELHGTAVAPDGTGHDLQLRQTAPGRYETTFPTDQVGTYLVNVGSGDHRAGGAQTVGLSIAYPPEYGDVKSNDALLQAMAEVGGGAVLTAPETVFEPRGETARAPRDVWQMLLLLALALFPLDVAVRRLILDRRHWRRRDGRPVAEEAPKAMDRLLARKTEIRERRPRAVDAPLAGPAAPLTGPAVAAPADEEPVPEAAESTTTSRLRAERAAKRATEAQRVTYHREPTTPPLPLAPSSRTPEPAPDEPAGEGSVTDTLQRLKRARERARRRPDDDEGGW